MTTMLLGMHPTQIMALWRLGCEDWVSVPEYNHEIDMDSSPPSLVDELLVADLLGLLGEALARDP